MDRLQRSHFLDDMDGKVFLTQFAAWSALTAETPKTDEEVAAE